MALVLFAGTAGARAEQVLSLYNWPNYLPPALLQRFEAETGIRVRLDIYDTNEKMLERIRAEGHGYDLVVPSDYAVATMIEEGLAEPMDAAGLENFANVASPHDAPAYDPERTYSAPYLWGTVGFSYDPVAIGEAELPDSWSLLFDPPEGLSGKLGMLDDEVEVYNAAAHYLGLDPCTAQEAEQARIEAVLERQKPAVAVYDSTGTVTRLLTGQLDAHMQWNSSAHRARRSRPGLVYVYPREGLTWWQDNFVIPRGAANRQAARTFVNWMMDPRNAAEASNFTGYMNAVSGSRRFLEPALAR